MAGFLQSLQAKIGDKHFATFRSIIEEHKSRDESPSIAAVQKVIQSRIGYTVSRSTIRDYLTRGFDHAAASVAPAAPPSPNEVAPASTTTPVSNVPIHTSILLRENQRLKKQLADREAGWEIIRDVLKDVYSEPLNILLAQPKESALPGSREVAVLHVTDVHYGKETPTYDIATCEARMVEYFNSVSEIVALRRKVAPVDEAVILLGGDMIEGEGIFHHQAWETQVDLIEQMVKSGPEYCVNLLLSVAQLFPKVRVHAVPGNHGRQGKFMSPRTNADSVFYEIVRKMVSLASPEAAARIEWDLPLDRERGSQWFSRFPIIGEWAGILVHGDQVKGQMGYSFYGWGKKIQGWNSAKRTSGFTHCFGGHWHTHGSFDVNSVTMFATGSPESSNCYALETMGAAGDPKQRLVFFNERYGTLADYPIVLS
jgi:hypothetical protein